MKQNRAKKSPDIGEELQKLRELLEIMIAGKELQLQASSGKKKEGKKRGRPKGEPKINFCLYMPHRLYVQLKNYLEVYGEKGETMASIIIAGAERELKERIARKIAQMQILEKLENRKVT